jgi:hypothetical protein
MDSTPESVRRAMAELQHKSRLLHEERDYYTSLFTTAHRAYEDHRRELTILLEKERAQASRREEELQAELQSLLAGNGELAARIERSRTSATTKLTTELERLQHEALDTEQRMRVEIERLHAQLLDERRRSAAVQEDLREHTTTSAELRRRQESLKVRVQRLTEERYLRSTRDPLQIRQTGEHAEPSESRSISPSRRIKAPFIPSGSTKHILKTTAEPATHNVHALVQTVRKANYRSPPRTRPEDVLAAMNGQPPPPQTGAVSSRSTSVERVDDATLRSMRQSLQMELEELRAEYDGIAHVLGDPQFASSGVSRKLRQLFEAIESKTQQLDAINTAQSRMTAAYRLSRMMDESDRRNHEASALHASIMGVVHSKSV